MRTITNFVETVISIQAFSQQFSLRITCCLLDTDLGKCLNLSPVLVEEKSSNEMF
jgi:hypothetical protein